MDIQESSIVFCPIGGCEEIGRNMYFYQYKKSIILVDVKDISATILMKYVLHSTIRAGVVLLQ